MTARSGLNDKGFGFGFAAGHLVCRSFVLHSNAIHRACLLQLTHQQAHVNLLKYVLKIAEHYTASSQFVFFA